jgi:hypothetical protein
MRALIRVVVLVVALAFVLAGCGKEVKLTYSTTPDNLVVEVSSSGGLPAPWDDNVASFRLYGDGRIVEVSGETGHGMLVEGRLDEAAVKDLLVKIRDAGFFGLDDVYRDKGIMDGVTERVAVTLTEGKKAVSDYMVKVPALTKTLEVIQNYPVNGLRDFVPEKGYLVVQKSVEPPAKPQTPPPEVAALIPPGDRLEQAVSGRKPIEMDGQAFLALKKWEATQQYVGADVQAGGTW